MYLYQQHTCFTFTLHDVVLLFLNNDLAILYNAPTTQDYVLKFEDFTLIREFVLVIEKVLSFFDVVITCRNNVNNKCLSFNTKYLVRTDFMSNVFNMCLG